MKLQSAKCPNCGEKMEIYSVPPSMREGIKNLQWWRCPCCWQNVKDESKLESFEHDRVLELGNNYLDANNWQEAYTTYSRVLEKYTWNANAWLGKGIASIGLGLSRYSEDNSTAGGMFREAEQYLKKPLETFYSDSLGMPGVCVTEPTQLEFYRRIISDLKSETALDTEIHRFASSLLSFLRVPTRYSALEIWPDLCTRLFRLGEFYFVIVRQLIPKIETIATWHYDIKHALWDLVLYAERADMWDKAFEYSGVRTNPASQVGWFLIKLKFSTAECFQQLSPIILEEPDENTMIIRGRVKKQKHSPPHKDTWVDYFEDYTFHRIIQRPESIQQDWRERGIQPSGYGEWRCEKILDPEKIEEGMFQWGRSINEAG